ncbi:hypothetical protein OSTOST_23243 [Ostertagia ostertagi]
MKILSAVDLYGNANTLPKDKTLKLCSGEETMCLYPLSCCFSVECTEYRLAELNIEGDIFHERWLHFGLALVKSRNARPNASHLLTLTSYLTLAESGLSDADESIAWLLPFTYPGPEDIVQYLTDWAEEIYAEKEGEDEGGEAAASKAKSGRKPGQVPSGAAIAAALGQLQRT